MLFVWCATQVDALIYQARGSAWLARCLSRVAAGRSASDAREAAASRGPGAVIGRIEIPRVGLSAMIADGCEPETLRRAVGHVPATARPGESGNVCLAAHRDSYFRRLRELGEGDAVRLTTPGGFFDYEVISTSVVDPDRRDVLRPTREPTLTLITCYPFHYVGPAPDRFVVRARAVGESRAALRADRSFGFGWDFVPAVLAR